MSLREGIYLGKGVEREKRPPPPQLSLKYSARQASTADGQVRGRHHLLNY